MDEPVTHEEDGPAAPRGRRFVVVAPHPADELEALGRLRDLLGEGPVAAGRTTVDVLCLTREPRAAAPGRATPTPSRAVLPDVDALLDDLDLDRDLPDEEPADEDPADEDGVADEDPADGAALAAYRRAGLPTARRVRLGLERDTVGRHEADVVGAISEIVGFAEPEGLCVLAPRPGDGGDDHAVAGRAAELVARAYEVDFVLASDPRGSRDRACGSATR